MADDISGWVNMAWTTALGFPIGLKPEEVARELERRWTARHVEMGIPDEKIGRLLTNPPTNPPIGEPRPFRWPNHGQMIPEPFLSKSPHHGQLDYGPFERGES